MVEGGVVVVVGDGFLVVVILGVFVIGYVEVDWYVGGDYFLLCM